jgi:fatty-acyl-CoA synthase
MMDTPLTIQLILERARRIFPRKEIVSRTAGGFHRYTYGDLYRRAVRLANVLQRLGVRRGDRVATFAWNGYRHLELYFAVPCAGAVLHTLNIRLFPDQIAYIINHAEDRVIFVDDVLLPALAGLRDRLATIRHLVVMGEGPVAEPWRVPVHRYEELLADAPEAFDFPVLDENDAAGMCYTSGTTGEPKGAVYSHRAIYLHSLAEATADAMALSERDTLLPVVPMFHVNCWGLPYAAALVGAKQVFTGAHNQPRDIAEMVQQERVTFAAGVPTIWIGLLALLERERYDLSSLQRIISGGSAVPQALIEAFEKRLGLTLIHAWGMTEMTPLGAVSRMKRHMEGWSEAERYRVRAKQGVPVAGVEIRAVDEQGREVPWDGKTLGELQVRGPWVIREYYKAERPEAFAGGWFRTGDVVTIDPDGYIQIADRTKDLVKSGGEWISSVGLESALMGNPKVLEAAVIAVPHPRWQERPLACVVPKPDQRDHLTKQELYADLRGRFAKWWLPDDIVFLESIPKTSVGKFDKKVLREQFKDYRLPESA